MNASQTLNLRTTFNMEIWTVCDKGHVHRVWPELRASCSVSSRKKENRATCCSDGLNLSIMEALGGFLVAPSGTENHPRRRP